ncbi:MAG: YggS family pyridoxal phosphate-dependent enzyme [Clostridiales Family XIII bacterium]|jgi:pyridoxal phosphate enzyme (YggS family)|nr:YggS family pyridoxal phosphate-dependent enzyme [Clostridiales Family XIII bacterium]
MSSIAENIQTVRERMARAALRSGRTAADITLIAVTKTRTPAEMLEAVAAGICDLGENKVQELEAKYDEVMGSIENQVTNFHFIGHLQRNKVKYIVGKTSLIHSVDSLRLAEEIDRKFGEAGERADVLIQVNAAREESKFGVTSDEASLLVTAIAERCANVRVKGLMCIAPAADDPDDVREVFRSVKALFDDIASRQDERIRMEWLSMGMTHDYEVAIEEGANLVRVGTGIFGARRVPA